MTLVNLSFGNIITKPTIGVAAGASVATAVQAATIGGFNSAIAAEVLSVHVAS